MSHRVVAIIPARSDSSRLPAKHLLIVAGNPMIYYLVNRLLNAPFINTVVLATTERPCDDELCDVARDLKAEIFRGPLDDVIGRFAGATRKFDASIAIKANGDNPLQAPEVMEAGITQLISDNMELVTGKNVYTGLPVGLGAEVLTRKAVEWLDYHTPPTFRDDTTRYVFDVATELTWKPILLPDKWRMTGGSITVDTVNDFEYFTKIVSHLPEGEPRSWTIEMILSVMRRDYGRYE